MYEELSVRGHQVKIITPSPRKPGSKNNKLGAIGEFEMPNDVLYLGGAADFKSPFHTTAQVSVSVSGEAVDKLLGREKFDITHFHEPWVPVLSRQILTRSNSINLATFHAKLPDTVMSKTIERVITPYTKSVLKYLNGLTAVSEAAASYVRTLTDAPVSIIPNGINLSRYRKSGLDRTETNNGKQIVYIGRLERRKGVKQLIKAFAAYALIEPSAKLIIAGAGPAREKLEFLADSLVPGKVKFAGYVDESEKLLLLRKADLFCSPALYGESFGIVLLEAMAAGVPVIAGDNPGYRSVMTGRGGISLINPHDTEAFARHLDLMLGDKQLRRLWRVWARDRVQNFSYVKVIDAYEHLYNNLYSHYEKRKV